MRHKLFVLSSRFVGVASIIAALTIVPVYLPHVVPVSRARSLPSPHEARSESRPAATPTSPWTATVPSLPPHALAGGSSSLKSVSCESPSYCVAVGDFTDSASHPEGLIDTYKDGKWTSMASPLPADGTPGYNSLNKVVCVPTTCTAIGSYDSSTYGYVGLILSLNAKGWAAYPAVPPADYSRGEADRLDNLACAPDGSCAVLGIYEEKESLGSYQNVGIFVTGSGGGWTTTVAPLPGDASVSPADYYLSEVEAVSCPTNGSCYALGLYSKGNTGGGALAYSGWGSSWSYQDLGSIGNV